MSIHQQMHRHGHFRTHALADGRQGGVLPDANLPVNLAGLRPGLFPLPPDHSPCKFDDLTGTFHLPIYMATSACGETHRRKSVHELGNLPQGLGNV